MCVFLFDTVVGEDENYVLSVNVLPHRPTLSSAEEITMFIDLAIDLEMVRFIFKKSSGIVSLKFTYFVEI